LPKEPLPIRLVFKLERAEHPRLYDELIRFRKGTKRVNRLRLLAYDGLLAQMVSDGLAARADGHGAGAEEGASAVTNDLFAPAIEA
jgi:homoserine dehydrogenase